MISTRMTTRPARRTTRVWALAVVGTLTVTGCGTVTMRQAPEPRPLSSDKIPDLRGSRPLAVINGQSSSEEIEIGTVGWGRLVGSLQNWTAIVAQFVKSELSQRGATIADDAPKTLTLSITQSQLRGIPIVGGATGTVLLRATTGDGVSKEFQGSASHIRPPSAINGAATDAVTRMLEDEAIGAYLRR